MLSSMVEQGSEEWLAERRGIPTASGFSKILTGTGKPAASADAYMHTLLAEWLVGGEIESYQNDWMIRGIELESRARAEYEIEKGIEVQQVGFVRHATLDTGCSPDGLLDDGGLEIKSPAPQTHIKYLLGKKCPTEYIPQVQGSIWICERNYWDFMSYHPDMPRLLVRVDRDDEYIALLDTQLRKFLDKMMAKREQLR
jgi:hypothetical protein